MEPQIQLEEIVDEALIPNITLAGLNDSENHSRHVVLGTIVSILDDEDWWYMACSCNKKVHADSGMYFCEKCNRDVVDVTPRYRIKVHVTDETDSATFVLFDGDATHLLNKTCAELLRSLDMSSATVTVPKDISDLIYQTFIFKVEVNFTAGSSYEKSYRVKKVSTFDG